MSSVSDTTRRNRRFRIDDYRLPIPSEEVSVEELRSMVSPPIPPDVDIWRDVDGGEDVRIAEDESVVVVPDDVFYTRDANGSHRRDVPIVIAGHRVMVDVLSTTGKKVRQLIDPPIPTDFTLYRDMDGSPDEKIDDDEIVTLRPGAQFFAVPSITPGTVA